MIKNNFNFLTSNSNIKNAHKFTEFLKIHLLLILSMFLQFLNFAFLIINIFLDFFNNRLNIIYKLFYIILKILS
jgi:hypothetical protein